MDDRKEKQRFLIKAIKKNYKYFTYFINLFRSFIQQTPIINIKQKILK